MQRRGNGARRKKPSHQRCTVGDLVLTASSKKQMVEKLEAHGYEAQRAKDHTAAHSFFQAADHFKKEENDER